MSFPPAQIVSLCLLLLLSLHSQALNLTLPHQHPFPEEVVQQVHRSVNASVYRRLMLTNASSSSSSSSSSSCLTGNPIDDCWRCDPNWATPTGRQRLAECAIGFGKAAMGGKGGKLYVVTDSSDSDPVSPKLGTLRYAVLLEEPLWIVFASDMTIKLRYELIINDYKTIDGRGANVHITGGGCITIQYVSNIIIHNIHIHDCVPAGNADVRSSPTHVGYRSKSDGDGISIAGASNIWIDHCFLAHCTDGLIDAVMGSTAITISNNHFERHNDVMLLGTNNGDILDSGMQVTIAFNHFGQGLVQRMPRCRRGYIHIVNNDITYWEIYAVGGSDNPTINSQGNRYIAPANSNAKEVTKRVDAGEKEWMGWNWRSEGDIMVNGAFFVPSGQIQSTQYTMAVSMEAKSAGLIDQLTRNAGVFGDPRDRVSYGSDGGEGRSTSSGSSSSSSSSGGGSSSAGETDFFGMIFGGGSSSSMATSRLSPPTTWLLSLVVVAILYSNTNHGALLSSSLTL